jgi:hypothetical protein
LFWLWLNLIGKKGGESNEKPLRLIIFILTHKVGITYTSTKQDVDVTRTLANINSIVLS